MLHLCTLLVYNKLLPDYALMQRQAGLVPDHALMQGQAGLAPELASIQGQAGLVPELALMQGQAGRVPELASMQRRASTHICAVLWQYHNNQNAAKKRVQKHHCVAIAIKRVLRYIIYIVGR
jgi:hypothetical protein